LVIGDATFTGSISGTTLTVTALPTQFTGSIAGTALTVTAVTSGTLSLNKVVLGYGIPVPTYIVSGGSCTTVSCPGGSGTYLVNTSLNVPSEVMEVSPAAIRVGQYLGTGPGITSWTKITAQGTGRGGSGSYIVNHSQTVNSETISASFFPTNNKFLDNRFSNFNISSGFAPAVIQAEGVGTIVQDNFIVGGTFTSDIALTGLEQLARHNIMPTMGTHGYYDLTLGTKPTVVEFDLKQIWTPTYRLETPR
jgi:hypothetical protein